MDIARFAGATFASGLDSAEEFWRGSEGQECRVLFVSPENPVTVL